MIGWLLSAIPGEAIIGALGLLGMFLANLFGKRSGAKTERLNQKVKDHERADDIRRSARDADGVSDDDIRFRD